MCAPLIPLIAVGLSMVSTGAKMFAAIGQTKAEAAAATANADAQRSAGQIGEQNMRYAALQQYRQLAAANGQQRLMAAAGGTAVGYGTAATAQAGTQILGQESLAHTYAQGNQNLIASDIAVANDLGQAAAARSRGTAVLVGGLANMGSSLVSGLSSGGGTSSGTVLGSSSQYAPFKTGMGL